MVLESKNKVFFIKSISCKKEPSYIISDNIVQKRISHTVGKNLIMPACKIVVRKLLRQDAE